MANKRGVVYKIAHSSETARGVKNGRRVMAKWEMERQRETCKKIVSREVIES